MKMRILLIAVLVLAAACPAAQPRQIYGHYMGCCPAGHGAIPYWFSKAAQCILDTNDVHAAVGGRYVNWPLMPYNPDRLDLGMESNAVLDIRRAMRAGLDGFAFDIPSVRLEKGEMVILTHDRAEAWGLNPLKIEKFKITSMGRPGR